MTQISMALVRELREKTQVGLMACKKALEESQGDIEKAVDLLRKRGAAVAAKRSGQETNEGVIANYISDDHHVGALVAVGCETDFSANNENMKAFVSDVAQQVATAGTAQSTVEDVLALTSGDNGSLTIQQVLEELTAKIGENIKLVKSVRYETGDNGFVQTYIHPGARLGVMIQLDLSGSSSAITEQLKQLGRDICMQIAVTNPLSIDPSGLDEATLNREKDIYKEQLLAAGKPEQMIDKIMVGKMNKYYEEVCLLNQKFIKNDKISIQQHIDAFGKEHGVTVTVANMTRFAVGK